MSGASMGPTCSSIWRVSWKGSDSGMSFQPKRGTPLSMVTSPSPALRADQKAAQRIDGGGRRFILVKQHIGDAARGIAAAFDLDAAIVPDAHAHIGNLGLLQHDDLVAADAGLAVGNGPGLRVIDGNGARPRVKHDKIIAEPVHLAKGKCACLGHFRGLYGETGRKS